MIYPHPEPGAIQRHLQIHESLVGNSSDKSHQNPTLSREKEIVRASPCCPFEFAALLPGSCFALQIEDRLNMEAALPPKMAIHMLSYIIVDAKKFTVF